MLCCDKKSVKMNKNTYKNPHFGANGRLSGGGGLQLRYGLASFSSHHICPDRTADDAKLIQEALAAQVSGGRITWTPPFCPRWGGGVAPLERGADIG